MPLESYTLRYYYVRLTYKYCIAVGSRRELSQLRYYSCRITPRTIARDIMSFRGISNGS